MAALEITFPDCVTPTETRTTPDGIKKLTDIDLYVLDAIGFLRGISYTNFSTGLPLSCKQLLERLTRPILHVLESGSVKVYVFSLDLCRRRRPEKAATSNARAAQHAADVRRGAPDRLEVSPGRDGFFVDNLCLPGPMNAIFNTPEARIQLYLYLTEYFMSERFRKRLPGGKRIFIRGCIGTRSIATTLGKIRDEKTLSRAEVEREPPAHADPALSQSHDATSSSAQSAVEPLFYLPPLMVTATGYMFVRQLLDLECSEADLDCFRWLTVFPNHNAVVHSRDGDLLLIGLIQSRIWKQVNPERKVYFRTRRSVGSSMPTDSEKTKRRMAYQTYTENLRLGATLQQAYASSGGVTRPHTRKRIVWCERYFDLCALRNAIVCLMCEVNPRPPSAPVEEWVLMLCLASPNHDYLERRNFVSGVGDMYIMTGFIRKRILFKDDLVKVWTTPLVRGMEPPVNPPPLSSSPPPSTSTTRPSSLTSHMLMYYDVNAQILRDWARECYVDKANGSIGYSARNNTPEKIQHARMVSAQKAIKKNLPSIEQHMLISAQAAWILQYYGNGPQHGLPIQNGLVVNEQGESIYGYNQSGFSTRVSAERIRRAPQH